MKKLYLISLVILIITLVLGGCAAPAPAPSPAPAPAPAPAPTPAPKAEPIEWKIVLFLPPTASPVKYGATWAERVTEKSNGALTVTVTGGPEAIPRADQFAALTSGVVDAVVGNTGMVAPYAGAIWCDTLSRVNIVEERKRGFYDYMNTLLADANLYYLGSCMANFERVIALKNKLTSRAELQGVKFRGDEAYAPYLKALGFSVVFMPLADVYTAMERGVVDGYHAVVTDIASRKLYEVSDYWIDHPLTGSRTQLMLNLKSLNALPPDLRDIAINSYLELEPEIQQNFLDVVSKDKKTMTDGGMEPITFSQEDAKWLLDVFYDQGWAKVKEEVSPEVYDKLREFKGE